MRYDHDHKANTRERVVREAAAAIRAAGPDRVRVADLMRRVGLTHGGFYAHFASKDALLAEAIDQMFAEASAAFFTDWETRDPRRMLERYVDYYLSVEHAEARDRGCPVPILAGGSHQLPEAARKRFVLGVGLMRNRIAALLGRAGVQDAPERAQSAVSEMVGAVSLARVAHDRTAADVTLDCARRSVRRTLGLSAPPDRPRDD